ncbi:MAG: DUF1573 domain-containing protein [Bacteroidales bacterium]|nr:DUF1573 domain-containing protein [Bacteroidales bacterium]
MRYTFMLLFTLLFFCSCGKKNDGITVNEIKNPATAQGQDAKKTDMPEITFEKTVHDFGKVIQGERLSYVFKFTNTGKSNLIIENANGSCNCTTTTPPKAPIKPGESGEITVLFDSKTKSGEVNSTVLVSANTYPTHTILRVTADVKIP